MARLFALNVVVAALFAVQLSADEAKPGGVSKLLGDYTIVAGERGGTKIPAERLKEVSVRIAADVITTYDKEEKEVYAASYEIDASAKPWRISLIATVAPAMGEKMTSEGLIEADGDTVRLIYALPGGTSPTSFRTGDKHQMFVLKKKAPATEKKLP